MDRGGRFGVVVASASASSSPPPPFVGGDGTTTAGRNNNDDDDDGRNAASLNDSKRVRVMEMNASERRAYVRELVQRTRRTSGVVKEDEEKPGEDDALKRRKGGGGGKFKEVKPRYMEYEWRRREARLRAETSAGSEGEGKTTTTRGGGAPDMSEERRTRLAGRHSRAVVEAEAEARRARRETFSPRTHARDWKSKSRRETTRALDALAAPKTALWERTASIKAAEDEARFVENCTFVPKTGRAPKSAASDKPASERLYEDAAKTRANRERIRAEVAQSEMEMLTFTPKTTTSSTTKKKNRGKHGDEGQSLRKPLHERVDKVLKDKENAMQAARMRVEDERSRDHTFQPTINPTSAILAKQRDEIAREMGEDVAHHQFTRRRKSATEGMDDELTFAPKITSKSARVVDQLARDGKIGVGFLERQHEFRDKMARRAAEQSALEDEECTFSPDIGNAASILRQSRHVHRLVETPEERAERLAFEDADRKRVGQREREREYYSQFTYEPELNEMSRRLAPNATDLSDLVYDERRELARKRAQAEKAREFEEEYTFQPNLNESAEARRARSTSGYTMDFGVGGDAVSARIRMYQREKTEALENLRRRASYRELEECTFRPETTSEAPGSMRIPSSSKVRGMDSFLQKQAKARQLEEEKRERYAKVFFEDLDNFDRRHRRTIPEPFSVAENIDEKEERRRVALEKEKLRRELEGCTFTPETNSRRLQNRI